MRDGGREVNTDPMMSGRAVRSSFSRNSMNGRGEKRNPIRLTSVASLQDGVEISMRSRHSVER